MLPKQSWEVQAVLLEEWRAWREEERNSNYFSKQGVKTNLKERKYRAMSEKNEGKETVEVEMRLV